MISRGGNQVLKLRLSCWLCLTALAAMIVLLLLTSDNSTITVLLQCSPLALVVPGLVLRWYRSYSWLSLMILLYFIVAITRTMAPTGSWDDQVFAALTVTIFFTSTFSSRWLQQQMVDHPELEPALKPELKPGPNQANTHQQR